jgi:hypothetical protein
MKRQLKTILFAFCALLVALSFLPSGNAYAQGCTDFSILGSNDWFASSSGISDATGWTFSQLTGSFGDVTVYYSSDGSTWLDAGSLPLSPSFYTSSSVYINLVNDGATLSIRRCPPVSPTATVTATATATAEIVVTSTPVPPSPTPTPDASLVLEELRDVQVKQYQWALFSGVVLLGLAALRFIRVR